MHTQENNTRISSYKKQLMRNSTLKSSKNQETPVLGNITEETIYFDIANHLHMLTYLCRLLEGQTLFLFEEGRLTL